MTRPKSVRRGGRIASRGQTNRRILAYRKHHAGGKTYVYHATKGWRAE